MSVQRMLVLLFVGVFSTALVFGQTGTTQNKTGTTTASNSTSIEEFFLSENQAAEVQFIDTQAKKGDREQTKRALSSLKAMIESGKITQDNREVISILDYLAFGSNRGQADATKDFPEVRKDAVELLGKVGGRYARTAILNVLTSDKETMVQSEAVYALGVSAGASGNAEIFPYIAKMLNKNSTAAAPDQTFAYQCLLAIEMISNKQGSITDADLRSVVLDVAYNQKYSADIKYKARLVYGKMRGAANK